MNGPTLYSQAVRPSSFPIASCFVPPYYENSLQNLTTSRDILNHLPSFSPHSNLSGSLSQELYSKSTLNCGLNENSHNPTQTYFPPSNFPRNPSCTTLLHYSPYTVNTLPERHPPPQNESSRCRDRDGFPIGRNNGHSEKECFRDPLTELKDFEENRKKLCGSYFTMNERLSKSGSSSCFATSPENSRFHQSTFLGVSQQTNVNSTVSRKPRRIVRRKTKYKRYYSKKTETFSKERLRAIWNPLFSPPLKDCGTSGTSIIDNCSPFQSSQKSNKFDICNLLRKEDNLSAPSFSGYSLGKISCDSSKIDKITLPTSPYATETMYGENKQSHPISSSTTSWNYKYSVQSSAKKDYFQSDSRLLKTTHDSTQFMPGTSLNGSKISPDRYSSIEIQSPSAGKMEFRDQNFFDLGQKQVGDNFLNFADESDTPSNQASHTYRSSPSYAESLLSQSKDKMIPNSYYQKTEAQYGSKDCTSDAFPNRTMFCRGINWLNEPWLHETRVSVLQQEPLNTMYKPPVSNKYQHCNRNITSYEYFPNHDHTHRPQREQNKSLDENEHQLLRQNSENRIPKKSSKMNKGPITRIFHCGDCPKIFRCKSQLKCHERTHTGVRPFICEICGDSFSQLANLTYHKRIHTNERPFICRRCGKTFRNSSHLNRHLRSRHTGEMPYSCEDCLMRFSTWDNKSRHKQPGKCPNQK